MEITGQTPEAPAAAPARPTGFVAVLILAVMFIAVAIALAVLPRDQAAPLVFALLGVLSVIGVFSLFAASVGILRFRSDVRPSGLSDAIVNTVDAAMVLVDESERVVWANRGYLTLSGAQSAAGAALPGKLYAGNPDMAEATYRLSRASRDRRFHHEEVRIAAPEGSDDPAVWLRIRTWPLQKVDGSGRRRKMSVWQIDDITEDRERQEGVFQELQHAIDFLDHAPAGFFSATAEGHIGYMNATLAGWLDIDLGETTTGGLSLRDMVAGDGAALLSSMAPVPGEVRTEIFDVDFVQRSGTAFPVRILHRVSFAADGTIGASRSLVLNRSHGEDISEDLRAAEVRFARFFNSAPIAIATCAADGTISRTNAAFARQFSAERTGNDESLVTLADLLSDEDQAALTAALAEAAEHQKAVAPVSVTFKGDKRRSGRLFISPVPDADAGKDAIIAYAIDTTDQRALELQFAQGQKMQAVGQLAGGIAHDFNNVLTAIIGFSDLLLANHKPTDPSFPDIMNIKQNANRAAGLVRQLLAFSRRQTMRPQVLHLSESISDLSMLLRRLIGETIALKVEHGEDLWPVKADLSQLEQVIINLAVNARDAMPDGGTLTIRTQNVAADDVAKLDQSIMPNEDFVLIEVTDTGSGMSAEIMEKIFEPFFSTKEVGKGTGLGLSTVYGIIKQTGGYVFPSSVEGKGTSFSIYLPRLAATEGEIVEKAPVKPEPADLSGHGTVLLVEDEDAVRAFAARALASRGYTVLEAETGAVALEVMAGEEGQVDLVVSDVVMPEMDGPTLLVELRKTNPDLKIIFVSGYAEEAFKKNLPEGEEFVFLPKPFSLKQLAKAVKETLNA